MIGAFTLGQQVDGKSAQDDRHQGADDGDDDDVALPALDLLRGRVRHMVTLDGAIKAIGCRRDFSTIGGGHGPTGPRLPRPCRNRLHDTGATYIRIRRRQNGCFTIHLTAHRTEHCRFLPDLGNGPGLLTCIRVVMASLGNPGSDFGFLF